MMIRFRQKGDFHKTANFLQKAKQAMVLRHLDDYGRMGVEALSLNTPVDTGLTAESWYYKIVETEGRIEIRFNNTNVVNNWCNIAIILQTGHATRNGGWVEGIDYINPAIQPIFDKLGRDAWEEITRK